MPTLRDVMTPDPITLPAGATVQEAARCMRENDIGDVILLEGGNMCGIVTDRDIAVRAVADGLDPATTSVREIASIDLVTLAPDDDVSRAVDLMRRRAVRRVPVVDQGRPVGVVSIGDLAMERDPDSALADISAAPANS